MRQPRIVFVSSPYRNAFFAELTAAFMEALGSLGVSALTTSDPGDHVVGEDDVFVLLPPHEYVTLEGSAFVDDPVVAARTIGVSAEQPHQLFFERNAAIAARLGAVLDFSPLAVAAYRHLGIDALHQPFGYVPSWDRYHGRPRAAGSSTTGVLYLGNKRPRRLAALAAAADALVRHDAVLKISDNAEPNTATSPSFVSGDDKRELLASTRLLINIHQSDEPYFEWLRFADAAHCGAPVLTERSVESEPFVDGVDYLSFAEGRLTERLDAVLARPSVLDDVAASAYATLRKRPLVDLLEPLVAAATRLLDAPPPAALPGRTRSATLGRDRTDPPPLTTWRSSRSERIRALVGGPRRTVTLAPPGTTWRRALELEPSRLAATCVADGIDPDGAATLEGIWPWEPWRLLHGQHLGRVMVVDAAVHAATERWIAEPWARDHPHVAVQLFAITHGIEVGHVPRPLATVVDGRCDPEHELPADVAQRCRQILSAAD